MQGEWKEILLENLADEITVGFVGSMTSEYVENGIPFFRSKNINPYRILWDDVKYISPQFHKKIEKSSLRPGDVVIVRTGKPGTASIIPDSIVDANCSDLVIVRPGSKLDKRFLVYYINSAASHHINAHLVGAVQQHFNVSSAKKMSIPLPTLSEQKRIAHILGSLDDKIELNRQMNATLEGMAQALFKSWFVDFDPVIDNALAAGNPIPEAFAARAETRRKALAHGTANRDVAKQFPEAFQFTEEMGWIPEGWKVVEAKEQIDVLRGFSYKGKGLCKKDEGVPMHNLNSVLEGGGYKYEGIKYYNLEFKEKFKIQQGDILVANTEQGHNHLLIGYGSMVPLFYKEGFFSHHLYRVRPKKNAIVTPEFIDQLFKPGNFVYQVQGYTNGTTVNMLPIVGLQLSKFICPPKDLVKLFSHQYKSIFCKKEKNYLNNLEIEQLRDTLLPKLISGAIRIPEAEKLTEEALA